MLESVRIQRFYLSLPILPNSTGKLRNRKATEQDMRKAQRVQEYLNNDREHCLYLRPKSFNVVACADASYAEHEDAKSHSGGCVGLEGHDGHDAYFMFISSKQPIVAKSSCEAELIAANTVGDYVVWLQSMLEGLGLKGDDSAIMYQDNQSTMRLAMQGKGTFKRSKHINVRYFWLKELLELGKLILTYLPTAEMVADIMTKPLVGYKFRYLLRKLLGYEAMEE